MGNISSCRGRSRTREKLEETFAPTASQSKPTESQFAERITTLKVRRTTTKDGIKSMVNSPFTSDEDSNTFSHLIFEENELERQVREGLLKLNLSLKNNGEYFNVPMFLKKYANNSHGVKILLKYHASSISERSLSKLPEAAYLIEQVKFLEMIFIGHPIEKDEPRILLKESHGNIIKKKVRMSRYRKLIPRVKIIKKKDFVIIVGKEFMLMLEPPSRDSMPSEFDPDGNGERPDAMGYYTRLLDTQPSTSIEWQAYIYDWYNKAPRFSFFDKHTGLNKLS